MIKYEGNIDKIKESVHLANIIYDDVVNWLRLEGNKEFFQGSANVNYQELANIMELFKSKTFYVKTYWYWSRKVNGKFVPSIPNTMFINTRGYAYNSMHSVFNLVYLIFHEHCHFLDNLQDEKFFHHFDNKYKPYKENTAPYVVDAIAEKIILKNYIVDRDDPERDSTLIYPSALIRLKRFFKLLFKINN